MIPVAPSMFRFFSLCACAEREQQFGRRQVGWHSFLPLRDVISAPARNPALVNNVVDELHLSHQLIHVLRHSYLELTHLLFAVKQLLLQMGYRLFQDRDLLLEVAFRCHHSEVIVSDTPAPIEVVRNEWVTSNDEQ